MNSQNTIAICRAFAVTFLLASTVVAHAASFDCKKAETRAEHIVCSSDAASQLDEQLQALYDKEWLSPGSEYATNALRPSQRAWLRDRNQCTGEQCVVNLYRKRIEAFGIQPNPVMTDGERVATGFLKSLELRADAQQESPTSTQHPELPADQEGAVRAFPADMAVKRASPAVHKGAPDCNR